MGTKRKATRVAHATIAHRYTMDRVLDRSLVPAATDLFKAETAKIKRALISVVSPQAKLDVSQLHVARMSLVLRANAAHLEKKIASLLSSKTRETQAEAIRAMAQFLGAIKVEGTALDDHSTVERLIRAQRKKLDDRRQASARVLVSDIVSTAQQGLRDLPKSKKASTAARDIGELVEEQAWKLQRTIRTETSIAFNATQDAAFDEISHEIPGIMRRWTELVNDLTGAPLDDRVAQDSLLLHGQVARPGQPFMMPSSPHAPSSMIGGSWMSPPNRPNDRAVLTPWYVGCGVPAWTFMAGERVILK